MPYTLTFPAGAAAKRDFSALTPLDSALPDTALQPTSEAGALARFARVRAMSRRIAARLTPEDMVPQSMPDASPAKWHLAHTSWFFETFILLPLGLEPYDAGYQYLFNSYYEALGARHPRPARGLVTRPGVEGVMAYRDHVDLAMSDMLGRGALPSSFHPHLALGLAHEEQHQELMLTDLLHLFAQNPLHPAYAPPEGRSTEVRTPAPLSFTAFEGGAVPIGHAGEGFAFDNERPRHDVLIRSFALADRTVTNAEWLEFMEDGGYRRPELWLSDGWTTCVAEGWRSPLYWEEGSDGRWSAFGLRGLGPLQPDAPVTHVSFYEADAYARWQDARLPTEAEWETAAHHAGVEGAWLDDEVFAPQPSRPCMLSQMFGDVWEWTASPYVGYPGFRPETGAMGEYNGKFMINQVILRGGSCATPRRHVRPTYRNFFPPEKRWQFTGVRLAKDLRR